MQRKRWRKQGNNQKPVWQFRIWRKEGLIIESFKARVEVRLKPGHVDSEGLTTEKALNEMDYNVEEVSTAKVYEIDLEADSLENAKEKVNEMCKKLLANPVKDDYKVEVEKAE